MIYKNTSINYQKIYFKNYLVYRQSYIIIIHEFVHIKACKVRLWQTHCHQRGKLLLRLGVSAKCCQGDDKILVLVLFSRPHILKLA